jgi:hypothetical protein
MFLALPPAWDYSSRAQVAISVQSDVHNGAEQNRRIRLALLISLILHVPLLLSPGTWRLGTLSDTSAPALVVRIEPQEGQQAEDDAAPSDTSTESEVAASRVEERLAATDIAAESAGSEGVTETAPPHPDPVTVEATPPEPPPEEIAPPVAPPEPVLATIAPAQERVLTRRLEREAHALLASRATERQLTFEADARAFTATLTRQPAADGTGLERVTVEIATEHGGEQARTSIQMKRLAFSHFTQLVDHWDPWVQLHDDEIAGRFHSNTEIILTYDRKVAPRLLGKVTTAGGVRILNEEGWRPRRKIFAGGLDGRAPRVRLPAISLPVAQEQATRNADVHVVRGDAIVIFHADGAYERIDIASRAETRGRFDAARPTYIVGVRDVELYVRGVVNGSVTVYSPKRIVVQGDLTYAQDPRAVPGADDYLGLVSDGTVEIDRANVTGPGDLDIHAAVYARRRFIVRDVRAPGGSTLAIYGSLTAGSLSESEPRYGTRTEFDPRFEHMRPPGFPETDRYEIEAWDGRWRVAETVSEDRR